MYFFEKKNLSIRYIYIYIDINKILLENIRKQTKIKLFLRSIYIKFT